MTSSLVRYLGGLTSPRGRDQCGHPDERQDERSPVQPDSDVTQGRIVGTRCGKPDEREQPGEHGQERRQPDRQGPTATSPPTVMRP